MPKQLRNLLSLVTALALVFTAGCGKDEQSIGAPAGASAKKAPPVSATRVEVAVLEGGNAVDRLIRPGEVIGAREAKLASALGGYVEKVMVESGDSVKQGDILARIDTSTHAAQLQLAKVELDEAKRELERVTKLGKAIPSARRDAAESRVARAQANQRLASTRLARATIRAPFDGVLVDLEIERGEVAVPGQSIGRLLVLNPVTISVSVTDKDVGLLSQGDPALVTTAGSPKAVQGTIRHIEPAADLRTRTFLVKVDVENQSHTFLPGMIAKVEFRPKNVGQGLLLPQDLLVTKLEDNGVFVVGEDNAAHWRSLELGEIVGSQVEVLDGIERGERIVTVGMRSLSEGDKLIITREGVCCTRGAVVFKLPASKAKPAAQGLESTTKVAPRKPETPAGAKE